MARLWQRQRDMTERRKRPRSGSHPLAERAKLRPRGPALERRNGQRLTVQVDEETLNRLRNAVFWTPGLTLAGFIKQCISERVDRMERARGGEFPQRSKPLKAGRPPR